MIDKKDISLVFYHMSDMDGQTSAAIIEYAYRKDPSKFKGQPWFMPWMYDYEFKLDEYNKYNNVKEIIILDITLKPEVMLMLKDINMDVTWIDHHATSIQDSKDKGYDDIKGLREDTSNPNNKDSACALTWRYYFNDDVPRIVRYTSDYDIWNRYMPEIDVINSALRSYNIYFKTTKHGQLHKNDYYILLDLIESGEIDKILKEGRAIERYRNKQFNMLRKRISVAEYNNKTLLILNNSGGDGSRPFEGIEYPHDAVVTFYMTAKGEWAFSIFTDDPMFNVSEIASSFGGGGHTKAAGWLLPSLDLFFPKLTSISPLYEKERELYKSRSY